MWIVAPFTKDGIPQTGLTPLVSIWRVSDNALLVEAQEMFEIGGGFYKYDWVEYDVKEDYVVCCDGGASLPDNERHTFGFSNSASELIKQIESGRWKIVNKQMIFYKEDGVTELLKFNLFDKAGVPAEENVYERRRV
jgi:hypothetical protein